MEGKRALMPLAMAGLLLGAVPLLGGELVGEAILWGAAATLKTTIHELGHVAYASAAGAEEVKVLSILPFAGFTSWRWPYPPTPGQEITASAGGVLTTRTLAQLPGWCGPIGERARWLLRLDPFLYVLRSLASRLGILPPLRGDDVAKVISHLADLTLGEAVIPGEKRRLEDLFYLGALAITSWDAMCALPGLERIGLRSFVMPPGIWCWEVKF